MPRERKGPATSPMQDRGNRDRDCVNQVDHCAIVVERSCAVPGCHGLSLVGPGVGNGDELDARHGRENPRVVLAQMADAHDSNTQRPHLVLPRSLARPCLP